MAKLLIDANLLVLLIAGTVRPELIGQHRRLRAFDMADYQTVVRYSESHSRHLTLPNVLSEASNLLGSGTQEIAPGVGRALAQYIAFADEFYEASLPVVKGRFYERLGLTDAAILKIAKKGLLVLTVDHALSGLLQYNGIDVLNLMQAKTPR